MDGGVEDEFPEFSESFSSVVKVIVGNVGVVVFPVWREFENEKKGVSDEDFAQVGPVHGGEEVKLFQIDVKGAVLVSGLDISVDSDWVVDEDLEIFNGIKEVKDVSNPGVHGGNNIVRNVEAVGVFGKEFTIGRELRSNNESIPPGSGLVVPNINILDGNTILSIWVAVSELLGMLGLKSLNNLLWSGSLHVDLPGHWVDKINKTISVLRVHLLLNISQMVLGSSRDISSGFGKL